MGKVTGLNPAMIMLSLSIWGKLLGLLGMIIALPVTYLLLVYYRRLIQTAPSTDTTSKS
jgi:predicted PurR-regulated permease PerM